MAVHASRTARKRLTPHPQLENAPAGAQTSGLGAALSSRAPTAIAITCARRVGSVRMSADGRPNALNSGGECSNTGSGTFEDPGLGLANRAEVIAPGQPFDPFPAVKLLMRVVDRIRYDPPPLPGPARRARLRTIEAFTDSTCSRMSASACRASRPRIAS
jgi:hypothetical protein